MFKLLAVTLAAVIVLSAVAIDARSAWAWVRNSGAVVSYGGDATLNVTRIGIGKYCLGASQQPYNYFGTYAAIIATPQFDVPPSKPVFFSGNSGWGNDCNKLGGNALYASDVTGRAVDNDFSVQVSWP